MARFIDAHRQRCEKKEWFENEESQQYANVNTLIDILRSEYVTQLYVKRREY